MVRSSKIARLSLVARYGRSPIFIGWSEDDLPVVSDNLSDEAAVDFRSARESGFDFPSLSSPNIVCFEFSSLGKGIDYPGFSEDVIPVNVRDENNKSAILNLGEKTILQAIEWSLKEKNIWNSLSGMSQIDDGSGITTTTPMFTMIFRDNRVQNGTMCALLFKPMLLGSNENTFLRFAKAVVKQLLVIEESQAASNRKGYITVAAKVSGGVYKPSVADLVFDTSDAKTARVLGKAKAGGLKLLKSLKIVDVSDELINEIKDPLPTYNVDSLDARGVFSLVSAMKELASYRNRP